MNSFEKDYDIILRSSRSERSDPWIEKQYFIDMAQVGLVVMEMAFRYFVRLFRQMELLIHKDGRYHSARRYSAVHNSILMLSIFFLLSKKKTCEQGPYCLI